jgi:elongation factor 1-gamma
LIFHSYPMLGYLAKNPKMEEKARSDVNCVCAFLDAHLATRTFLVGERATLADIVVVCSLLWAMKMAVGPDVRAKCPNFERWFLTCVNQPQFAAVLGPVELCASAAAAGPAKAKAEEKPKAKAEEKPKKKQEEEEDDGDDVPKEEKPRLSPEEDEWIKRKSPMDMDTVKRLFSNNKYDAVSAEFWAGFDHTTYTCWECTYNYNDDNKIDWQTANYVGGVLQRLEEARKVSYGVITMSSETKPFYVQGFFLFKFKEVPTFVKESADFDCFTYKQVDITNEAGQARMREFWCGETVDGRKVGERRFCK